MSRKEERQSLNTIGGRIQNLRLDHNMTRTELYEIIKRRTLHSPEQSEEENKSFENTMARTVRNWEHNKHTPSLEEMITMSHIFKCSMDYLCCGIKEVTWDNHEIVKATGLSEHAVEKLIERNKAKEKGVYKHYFKYVSGIICNAHLIDAIGDYLNKDYSISSLYYSLSDGSHNAIPNRTKPDKRKVEMIAVNENVIIDKGVLEQTAFNRIRKVLDDMKEKTPLD